MNVVILRGVVVRPPETRAEALAPAEFLALAEALR